MNTNHQNVEKIIDYIFSQKGSNLAKLSLESLSKAFGIHQDELAKMTLDDNETSIHHFLNRQKVFLAMKTLDTNPNITAEELATLCGFSNYQIFKDEFYRYFLIDPQKYSKLKKYAPLIKRIKKDLPFTNF